MKNESIVQQEIQIDAAKFGCVLLRNNSGALRDNTGRMIRFGLGNVSKILNDKIKSSDLIGILPTLITQEMVGQTIGVFVAIECKEEDWNPEKKLDKREQAQKNFIDWVLARGGIAGFCNSVEALKKLLGR